LAPEQVRICTVSEKSEAYGRDVEQQFQEAGLRTAGDYRPEKLGAKIRNAQLEKIPYTVVVGPRDETAATLSLRDRVDGSQETMPVEEAIEKLLTEARSRVVRETSSTESVELAADNAKQSKN